MKPLQLLFATFLILIFNHNLTAQITLSSQTEVDAWDQSITILTEDLTITGPDITNIDALSNLTAIESRLDIEANPSLTNIDGLSGLTQIQTTGRVNLQANQALTDIGGFLGLTDVDGAISIQSNDALTNIDGLSNLDNVTGVISLWFNDGLTNINGFLGLEDFTGRILITNCDALIDFNGFSNLANFSGLIELTNNDGLTNLDVFSDYTDLVGRLTIKHSDGLTNIDALASLTNVSGTLELWDIPALTDINVLSGIQELSGIIDIRDNENLLAIDGFSNLITINGELKIRSNNALANIDELSNLTTVNGTLEINSNEQLENIDGLEGLAGINGAVEINNNDNLSNLNVFSDYTNIAGELLIEDNDGLTNLDDLSSLTELTGTVTIKDNIGLLNVNGFSGLTDIAGTMNITNNQGLMDIQGFSNLTDVSGNLRIRQNSNLANINGLFALTNLTGRIDIADNDALANVDGLLELSILDGGLYISGNDALTNVDGLGGITTITANTAGLYISKNNSLTNIDSLSGIANLESGSKIEIRENASLLNIDGLSGLVNANGSIYIEENHALTNIDGLASLTEITNTTNVRIINNDALTNLDGLINITLIRRYLLILDNSSLQNIDGLSNVEEILFAGNLEISGNPSLTNIDGLSGLRVVDVNTAGGFTLQDNDLLRYCCGLEYAIENGDLEDFVINMNQEGCNSPTQILDACSLVLNYDQTRPCEGLDNGRINFFASDYDTIPFSYQWEELTLGLSGNGLSAADNFSIENLAAGTYNVTISLQNGAQEVITGIVLDPIVGSVFEILEITTANSTNGTASGNIQIAFSGGTPPYEVTWSGPIPGSLPGITDNSYTVFNLSPGEYIVQLTDADAQSKIANITLLDEVIPSFPCSEPLDIVILNDVSGSVNEIEYDESKTFFVDFLASANIGEGAMESQATIIEWASNAEQSVMVPLTGNMQALENYENATRAFSGGTFPHPAMQFAADYIETNGRSDVEKVFILSTDGTPPTSLIYLADELKANGYHIVTIAFDYAYSRSSIRDILTQVASVPLLASGAAAYSDLDSDLADNIVNLYLCPLNPGSSSSVYFNRDGAIEIDSVVGDCPVAGFAEVTFTISAHRELSLPVGTSVMFYHNDPLLFGATPILDFSLPCAIPIGSSETHTVTLPINTATKLYVLLNDDGNIAPPLNFPITDLQEIAFSNNIDTVSICINNQPTLQALKYTTTPTPICDSILMYTIDVCNIGSTNAIDVVVTDDPPAGATLTGLTVNTNNCSIDNGNSYDIPAGCCVSITVTYNASAVANGYYGIQNVTISGPLDQEYLNYDGSLSSAEDVIVKEENTNCPSTEIWFTKEVNTEEICEDGFLSYTYTIHNETSAVIHGARFLDILPFPMDWVYKPYLMNGLSINAPEQSGTIADFIIDEIRADTVATFQMDAYTGDWPMDGTVAGSATIENVIDLENGGLQDLESNEVSTIVYGNFPCDSIDTNTLDMESLSSILVFPNPSTGTIQFKNLKESVKYRLFNATGTCYEEGEYLGGDLKLRYEGVNLVQLFLDAEVKIFKVVRVM
jgi:uncharacterized repeat protein (TIGR01451 family)